MITYLLKFLAIYFACLFKFIAGPVLGLAAGFSVLETMIVTLAGMMTSVVFVTYLGQWFKLYWQVKVTAKKKVFSKKNRRIVSVWRKFGVIGIAALTPVLLTPIGGTIIMTAFNVDHRKIISSMLISGIIWGLIFSLSIEYILAFPLLAQLFR